MLTKNYICIPSFALWGDKVGILALKVLVATIDAQWEEIGDCRVGEVRADTTSPMYNHEGF